MRFHPDDTIAALASAPGPGTRAVVRLSGPDAWRVAASVFAGDNFPADRPAARGLWSGGVRIAGTGTIDSAGTVGTIGGIAQKMDGARQAGARWFFAPAGNCNEVVGNVPDGLRVVRSTTLHESRLAVQAIAAGRGAGLPTCD